ncbi:ankyrin repeat domain-containing protein [Candidatus Chromulinivorax destructor]|uniref:Uncharacterized protein n=1 Tax=Candidatus Chromulinivorax destructor TaxID=2066483 RepID=A0A345ZCQ9_9BACT|nr:ankyrin repeat domain-containing protein [Candidatus Chromulinivorax destructor]AXK61076.1 hypothetical protein C0J27_05080 [Candidatus Chromulinivorax destructor]
MMSLQLTIKIDGSEQIVTPAQNRQDIIDLAMESHNYRDLKQDLAFLESQGLLELHSFFNVLNQNITESDDATFDEVIEKAQDLITEQMKESFISTIKQALYDNKPLANYINYATSPVGAIEIPLFTYIMQRKNRDEQLNNMVKEWLFEWGNQITYGESPLHIASKKNHTEIINLLLQAAVNVDIKTIDRIPEEQSMYSFDHIHAYDANNYVGATPLLIAAQNNNIEIVKILLTAGAKPNIQTTYTGISPLIMAVFQGNTKIAELLITAGSDVNLATSKNGWLPSYLYLDYRRYSGATPLFIAAHKGDKEMVKLLIKAQADVNLQTTDDKATPLLIAAQSGFTEIVQYLVDADANINLQNTHGQVALNVAITDEIREIIRSAQN